MDVFVVWLAALLDLEKGRTFERAIPAIEGRYRIIREGCKAQIGHNNVNSKKEAFISVLLFIASTGGKEEVCLYGVA